MHEKQMSMQHDQNAKPWNCLGIALSPAYLRLSVHSVFLSTLIHGADDGMHVLANARQMDRQDMSLLSTLAATGQQG